MSNFLSSFSPIQKLWAKFIDSSKKPGCKRRGVNKREDLLVPACVEMLEKREMLAAAAIVGVTFNSGTGVLAITGTSGADSISVVAGATSTNISVNGSLYQTLKTATNANLTTVNFT